MKEKELVKTLMERMQIFGYFPSFTNVKTFIEEYEKLTNSEPEIPVVPQFVADWIERSKQENRNLRNALNNGGEKMRLWFLDQENYDFFARAWLDGYTIEKEKRYTVVMKETKQPLYYNVVSKKMFFSMGELVTSFTRKELEEANFGWVFDCEGIEVEEVEE